MLRTYTAVVAASFVFIAIPAAGALCATAAGEPGATGATACSPPRGPGDNLVHSHRLHTHDLSCRKARAVALACTRFTYGHRGRCYAVGRTWSCRSHREGGLGSAQRCTSGRRSMSIHWDD